MQLGFLTGAADSELRPQARAFGWVVLWPSVVMSRPRKSEDLAHAPARRRNTECQPFSFTSGFRGGGRWLKAVKPQTSKPLPAPTSLHTVVPKHQTNSSCRCATLKSKPGTPTKSDAPPQSMQQQNNAR